MADQFFDKDTPPSLINMYVGGTQYMQGTLANTAEAPAANLNVSLTSTGALSVTDFTSTAGSSVAPESSSTIRATINAGTTAGSFSWQVTNTDLNAMTTTASIGATAHVYDRADGTFNNFGGDGLFNLSADGNQLAIDLGSIPLGTSDTLSSFDLLNAVHTAGFTNWMSLNSINAIGDSQFSLSGSNGTSKLAAGNSLPYALSFSPSSVGSFHAKYTFNTEDWTLVDGQPTLKAALTVDINATVVAPGVPLPSAAVAGLSLLSTLALVRRPRK